MHNALIHDQADSVGVAVRDIEAGEHVVAVVMGDGSSVTLQALGAVPLGHKIALRDVAGGEKVVKYGEAIGVATTAIRKGEHVHVQNLQSARWALSAR